MEGLVVTQRARPLSGVAESLPGQVGGGVARTSGVAISNDLSREVYCILGVPIDAIEMPAVLRHIDAAAARAAPFVISTPNLNFLVTSQDDPEFRESLLLSDLCPTDGMPILWIARLMGIPIKTRIAGSDIFEALKARPRSERHLKVFLFGATESVVAAAAKTLNDKLVGLTCVGWIAPGYGTLDELSLDHFIDEINLSNADFLVAALDAKKGQLWLQRNYHRLRIPIRAQLGATINFQAGTVKRAPYTLQNLGLEWLWRIRQEPYLWRRYWHDGGVFLRLMVSRVLPLTIRARSLRRTCERNGHDLVIEQTHRGDCVTLSLSGFAIASHVEKAISCFQDVVTTKKWIVIDFSETRAVDARFLGLLLMVRKQLKARGADLKLLGLSRRLERTFRLNGLEYLLSRSEA
jgi:N-acetylglucosaminyldiphosphoundecaprenol N-acetyl-beta-D-mannosaminyltransferase